MPIKELEKAIVGDFIENELGHKLDVILDNLKWGIENKTPLRAGLFVFLMERLGLVRKRPDFLYDVTEKGQKVYNKLKSLNY